MKKTALVVGSALTAIFAPLMASAATLFTAPTATSTFTSISPWSSEAFDSFLPIVYIIVGVIVGALLVLVVIRSILKGAYKVLGGGRGGRRGRRR